MDHARLRDQAEVVHEAAVGVEGLRADARPGADEIGGAHGGDERLQRRGEGAAADRAIDLAQAGAPVAQRQALEAREAERIPDIPGVDIAPAVALAAQGEDGVGTGLDGPVDAPSEVHAQEGEIGVGHGVDEVAHEAQRLRSQRVVLAAEGNDAQRRVEAGEPRDAVGHQPGAVDEVARLERAVAGVEAEAVAAGAQTGDLDAGADDPAAGFDQRAVAPRDGVVVGDARRGDVQGADAAGGGLELGEFFGADLADAGHAVGPAAVGQRVQAAGLRLVGRHDDLAAALVGDVVLPAELQHLLGPAHGEPRLGGAGPIVEAAVDHAAVVPRLVLTDVGLLLDHDDGQPGEALDQGERGGQANDAAADDGDVARGRGGGGRAAGGGRRVHAGILPARRVGGAARALSP